MLSTLEALATTVIVSCSVAALLHLEYSGLHLLGHMKTQSQSRLARLTWTSSAISSTSCTGTVTPHGVRLQTCKDATGRSLTFLEE